MAQTPPARTRWPAVLAAIFAGVVGGFAFGKMAPALPALRSEFGLSLVQAGWLVAAFNALAAASAIFFGIFADRVGAFRLCLAGVLCVAAGSALGALAPDGAVLVLSRFVEGLGFLSIVVSAPALIGAAATPDRRGIAYGLWACYFPVGVSVVIAASPPLLEALGWRSLWWLVAAAAIACAALLAMEARHYAGVRRGTERPLAGVRGSLAQPVLWLLGLAFAMYAIQHHALMIWLPTYLMQTRGLGVAPAALATALAVVVNCIGNVAGGWLVQRGVPRGRIIAATFLVISAAFFAIFSGGLPDILRYVLAVLYSLIAGTVPAAVLSAGMRYARSPAEVGAVQGLIVQLTNVGIFFGPPMVAAAVTWGGSWDATVWVLLGCSAVALVSAFLIARLERSTRLARA
jgi:MFS transporter, CP family, cyanate transporter